MVSLELKVVKYSYTKPNGVVVNRERSLIVFRAEDAESQISRWAKDGHVGKALEDLTIAIEAVNLALAVQAVISAEPGETRRALLSALGSALDAVGALNAIKKIGDRKVKAAGAASAIIDAYLATVDGIKAYDRDDTSSAIGFGAIGLGSVLTFIGCMVAVTGIGASVSVVGIPLGILLEVVAGVLVAAGYLINIFGADTDIEQFVSHSKFGVNFPSTSNDPKNKPKWAIGSFADWADNTDGLSRQVESLILLLANYAMEARGPRSLRLTLGLIAARSSVELHFKTDYGSGITHDTTLLIDLATRAMSHVRGDPQELRLLHVDDSKGHLTIDVTADWPDDLAPKGLREPRKCTCDVLLNLNDKLTVPLSGAFRYLVADVHGIARVLGDRKTSWE